MRKGNNFDGFGGGENNGGVIEVVGGGDCARKTFCDGLGEVVVFMVPPPPTPAGF